MDEVYLLLLIMTPVSTLPTHWRQAGNEQPNAANDAIEGRVAALFFLTLANMAAPFSSLGSQSVSPSRAKRPSLSSSLR